MDNYEIFKRKFVELKKILKEKKNVDFFGKEKFERENEMWIF